jgi:hypothetical protein
MKCAELARHVEAVGQLVEVVGGSGTPAQTLFRLLGIMPQKTVAQIAKVLQGHANGESEVPEVRRAAEFALAISSSMKGVAKAALINDFAALGGALGNMGGRAVEDLVGLISSGGSHANSRRASVGAAPATDLREHLILRYHRLLEHALGDDPGFAEAYRAVETDQDMRAAEIIALAKRFAFATVKSRVAALKKIQGRHQALMISRAKTNATGGRLAG